MKAMFLMMLLFLLSTPVLSQERVSDGTANLQLTTRIAQQRYCDSGYSDMAQLSMSLQLTYINIGQQPLIIYRGSNLPHYVLVSLSEQNAKAKNYELNQHVGWVTSGEPKLVDGSRPGKEFVVLNPGQSYQIEADISIPVALEPSSQFLKAGKYVLQVIVDTWPANGRQFYRLNKKWKETGLLWSRSVRSEPMPIEVEKEPKIVGCK